MSGNSPEQEETLTDTGVVDTFHEITEVVTTGAATATLADGVQGQSKFIVMKTDGGDMVITPANLGNGTTITLDDAGDCAQLKFTNAKWYMMGGTATLA